MEKLQLLLRASHALLGILLLVRDTEGEASAPPALLPSCLQHQQEVIGAFMAFLSAQGKRKGMKTHNVSPERRVTSLLEPTLHFLCLPQDTATEQDGDVPLDQLSFASPKE